MPSDEAAFPGSFAAHGASVTVGSLASMAMVREFAKRNGPARPVPILTASAMINSIVPTPPDIGNRRFETRVEVWLTQADGSELYQVRDIGP